MLVQSVFSFFIFLLQLGVSIYFIVIYSLWRNRAPVCDKMIPTYLLVTAIVNLVSIAFGIYGIISTIKNPLGAAQMGLPIKILVGVLALFSLAWFIVGHVVTFTTDQTKCYRGIYLSSYWYIIGIWILIGVFVLFCVLKCLAACICK